MAHLSLEDFAPARELVTGFVFVAGRKSMLKALTDLSDTNQVDTRLLGAKNKKGPNLPKQPMPHMTMKRKLPVRPQIYRRGDSADAIPSGYDRAVFFWLA